MDYWAYMLGKKHGIEEGGGTLSGCSPGGGTGTDVRYLDYDGTVLYSYSAAEALALTAAPALPKRKGLVCQSWNVSLEEMKSYVSKHGKRDIGANYITDDGKTRLYIHLEEGRTSPMLGVCPNGTVTVDWGDGTEPDVLTGTSISTVQWTPNHQYASPGDYVIKLTVDGEMSFNGTVTDNAFANILRNSASADGRNKYYQASLRKVEIGDGVPRIKSVAFYYCTGLESISIPKGVEDFGGAAFAYCFSLTSLSIPKGVTAMGDGFFYECGSLAGVSIPDGVTSFGSTVFFNCSNLAAINMPDSVESAGINFANNCPSLVRVTLPENLTNIAQGVFTKALALGQLKIPGGVTSIDSGAFSGCSGVAFYDFSIHTAVPALAATDAFNGIADDCEIRVPAALAEEWKAATNWATYADYIVGV